MCGIVGVIGRSDALALLHGGLRRLEYRGYDSAGLVVANADTDGEFIRRRAVGKLAELGNLLESDPVTAKVNWGIGHTRWATHGGVTEANAHPIMDAGSTVAVVHNGIIENHRALREELTGAGHRFSSDTDTEVLCHLFAIEIPRTESLLAATAAVLARIEGAYAFAVMAEAYPGAIALARAASPLAIGIGEDTESPAHYIGSDAQALAGMTRRVMFLQDGDYGVVTAGGIELRDKDHKDAKREVREVESGGDGMPAKDGYAHFMQKEIFEQPDAIAHSLAGIRDPGGGIRADAIDPGKLRGLLMLGAGTSHHAAMIARYWFESMADIPATAEIASEFRYRNPSLAATSLAMGISQSGESIDTLMALRHAAGAGVATIGLVNVAESTIAREADSVLLTRAGIEVGVASTKAFTAQLTILFALALACAEARGRMDGEAVVRALAALESLPRLVGKAAEEGFGSLAPIAARIARRPACLFLGRGPLYPLALEGALKLKEVSYIHAAGYAAGELKHGPIALIERGLPVVVFLADDPHLPKTLHNLKEAQARGGDIIVLATAAAAAIARAEGDIKTVIALPDCPGCDTTIAPILLAVPAQILAYLVAVEKGTDVDQPRNLAKSVTVE